MHTWHNISFTKFTYTYLNYMLVRRCLASECEFKVAKQVLPLQQTNIQFSQYVPKESYSAAVKYNSRGTTNSYKCVPLDGTSWIPPDHSYVTVNFRDSSSNFGQNRTPNHSIAAFNCLIKSFGVNPMIMSVALTIKL